MGISFPGESAQYRVARDRLLEREAELRRLTEAVAAARRELPPGGVVPQDYVFQEAGPGGRGSWPMPGSAAGGGCGCCPRPGTPTTATITGRAPTVPRCRS